MIKIGITPSFLPADLERTYFGPKELLYTEREMIHFLSKKGVLPVLLLDLPVDLRPQMLSEIDGVIFSGGDDLSPALYGEEKSAHTLVCNDERDKFEQDIFNWAFENKKPMFGICRGFQFLNVMLGGTLYQDINDQKKDSLVHKDSSLYDKNVHEINIDKGSELERLYPDSKNFIVNSVHHQGIKDLSEKLKIEAVSTKDKIIEAFRYFNMDEQFIYGVQWHPEFSSGGRKDIMDSRRIYDMFLERIVLIKSSCR